VTCRLWRSVVIVVPSLPKREHGNPEAIGRRVARKEALRSPHVCCGIYEPSAVEIDDRPQEDAPKKIGPSTTHKKCHAQHG
jgi:hypothetical protein